MDGALAGAVTAILLLRERPGQRVLVVEKSAAFGRRVGEATVLVYGRFGGETDLGAVPGRRRGATGGGARS